MCWALCAVASWTSDDFIPGRPVSIKCVCYMYTFFFCFDYWLAGHIEKETDRELNFICCPSLLFRCCCMGLSRFNWLSILLLAAAGYVTGGWTEKRCTSVGSHHHVVQQQRSQSHTQVKKVDSSSLSVQHIYLVGDRRRRYIHVQSIKSVVTGGQQSKTCWPDIFKYIKDNIDTFVCVCVCRRTPF